MSLGSAYYDIIFFTGKCTWWWNICNNKLGFIDVVLFSINKTVKSPPLYDYTFPLSSSNLAKYKSVKTIEGLLHKESEAYNHINH